MNKFTKNVNYITILNIVGTLIYQGINFILTPYLTRALSLEAYGIVSVYISWSTLLVPIISLTTLSVIPHIKLYIPEHECDMYVSSMLGLSLCSTGIVTLLTLIGMPFLVSSMELPKMVIVFMIMQSFGMGTVNFIVAYWIQYQETNKQFMVNVTMAIVTSVFSVFLIQLIGSESQKYMGRIIGLAMPNFIFAVGVYIYIVVKKRPLFNKKVWRYTIPICIPIIFHLLANTLLSQNSRIMLQKIEGFERAAIYSYIYTIASLISVLWVALNNAWVPVYFDMLGASKYELIEERGKKYIFFFTSIVSGFLLVSPELLTIIGGAKYSEGISIMPFMVLSMYFMFMYSFSINFKTICKNTMSIAVGTCCASLINMICNQIFINKWGLIGAAIATFISYVSLFLFHQLTVREKSFQYSFKKKFFLPYLSMLLGCLALYEVFINMWYLRWLIGVVIGLQLVVKIFKQKSIF